MFYAAQPYLLQLYGDPTAYGIAGLGGRDRRRRPDRRRADRLAGPAPVRPAHDALLLGGVLNVVLLVLLGLTQSFVVALLLLAAWAFVFAVEAPLRQAFINGLIPSEQRATVLSFDSLMGSAGGVVAQPALGRGRRRQRLRTGLPGLGRDLGAGVPFVLLARREHAVSDPIDLTNRASPR